ncbi:MAG: DUF2268 domain-containing putative Zn-dependent protease [Candidatus Uhrbacteria bacterium]|nr:hypothetical protein [Patescibacteria group bacterium]MBU1906952.1 hypothetical protein [Patescibacteria group bacterium]
MEVKNLVRQYVDCVSANGDINDYLQTFSSLFEHYFSFWSVKNLPFSDNIDELIDAQNLILKRLPYIEQQMRAHSILAEDLRIVLFVGQNTTNGHAAFLDGDWWVWIPVESYISNIRVEAFLTHEIIHGIHYALHPDCYFNNSEQKYLLSRQILTEGLATYCTSQVMNLNQRQVLWADYISDQEYQSWLDQYEKNKSEIFSFVQKEWDHQNRALFEANDPNDILQFRAGYLAGLEIIESVAKQIGSVRDLLEIDYGILEKMALEVIKEKK